MWQIPWPLNMTWSWMVKHFCLLDRHGSTTNKEVQEQWSTLPGMFFMRGWKSNMDSSVSCPNHSRFNLRWDPPDDRSGTAWITMIRAVTVETMMTDNVLAFLQTSIGSFKNLSKLQENGWLWEWNWWQVKRRKQELLASKSSQGL